MMILEQIYTGIDVSSYQGIIDWNKVRSSGYEFAMIRAGYGTKADRYFGRNMDRSDAAGIKRGAYLYSYAHDADGAKAEAETVLMLLRSYGEKIPVAYDMESNAILDKLTNTQRSDNAIAFMSEIEAAGYYPLLYSNRYWLENKFDDRIAPYDKWVAIWGVQEPSYDGNMTMWQYSSSGSVGGISGNVDLDIAYKDYWKTGGDDMDLQQAIQILENKGIVNTPDYWLNASKCVKYLDLLLINMAEAINE